MMEMAGMVWNSTLYIIKSTYEIRRKIPRYNEVAKTVQETPEYQLLPSVMAQQVVKRVYTALSAHYGKRKRGKYSRLPEEVERYNLILVGKNIRVDEQNGKVWFPFGRHLRDLYNKKRFSVPLPPMLIGKEIKQIEIKYHENEDEFYVIYYYRGEKKEYNLDEDHIIGVDLGVDNLATVVDGKTGDTIIVDGRALKSKILFYRMKLYEADKNKHKMSYSEWKRLKATYIRKRNNFVEDYLNKTVKKIIDFAIQQGTGTIVVGSLKYAKKDVFGGYAFQKIPYSLLKRKLKGKCEEYGIRCVESSEVYTSRTDALSLEPFTKKSKGKRVYRGLYRSSTGKKINADVNAALNIIRQCCGDEAVLGAISSKKVFNPRRVYLF